MITIRKTSIDIISNDYSNRGEEPFSRAQNPRQLPPSFILGILLPPRPRRSERRLEGEIEPVWD